MLSTQGVNFGTDMDIINNAPGAPTPVGPYSQAVRAGGLLFVAGQVGIDPQTGKLVSEDDVARQTQQVLRNLDAVLRHAGSSFEKVVMTSIFLTDMAYFAVLNPIYGSFVNKDAPPARQTVAVKQLPLGALVEISLIAL